MEYTIRMVRQLFHNQIMMYRVIDSYSQKCESRLCSDAENRDTHRKSITPDDCYLTITVYLAFIALSFLGPIFLMIDYIMLMRPLQEVEQSREFQVAATFDF